MGCRRTGGVNQGRSGERWFVVVGAGEVRVVSADVCTAAYRLADGTAAVQTRHVGVVAALVTGPFGFGIAGVTPAARSPGEHGQTRFHGSRRRGRQRAHQRGSLHAGGNVPRPWAASTPAVPAWLTEGSRPSRRPPGPSRACSRNPGLRPAGPSRSRPDSRNADRAASVQGHTSPSSPGRRS